MIANKMKSKAEDMETQELANGAVTVEYVIIVLVIVGLGAAMFAFQTQIKTFLTQASNNLKSLLDALSAGSYSPTGA